jgi:hypothetical protein
MPRPQFTLRALLVAMLVVGAFFGGFAAGQRHERTKLAETWDAIRHSADYFQRTGILRHP